MKVEKEFNMMFFLTLGWEVSIWWGIFSARDIFIDAMVMITIIRAITKGKTRQREVLGWTKEWK